MVRHLPFLFLASLERRVVTSDILTTQRLRLCAPQESDVDAIMALLGDFDVARNLSSPPHPYREEHARAYIESSRANRLDGSGFNFAVCRQDDAALIGMIGTRSRESGPFELGYWIGKPFWGHGYATEAGRRLVEFAFAELVLPQLIAGWFVDNPPSGRVLEKLGFVYDGEDERHSNARGEAVRSHRAILERARWEQLRA
jgi:ribosomal-protein-alanine N-acetyltransferase